MAYKLSKVVVLNESSLEQRRGDVSVFSNIDAARNWVEPIDVTNHEYFGYLIDGTRLRLSVIDGEVEIAPDLDAKCDPALVRRLLEEAADFAAEDKLADARVSLKELSIEALLDAIGFVH